MEALKYLRNGRAPGPSEDYAEMILASGYVGIRVLVEICHRILDEKGMPETGLPVLQFILLMENEMS